VTGTVVNTHVGARETEDGQSSRQRSEPVTERLKPQGDSFELSREALEIRELQARDREVRDHEAAHAAAGGVYAGAPTYSMKRGPDGKNYVTGGEVSIDIAPVSGDPRATLDKAEQVRAAALAPVQPSSQDMRVAQKAQAMAARARAEIAEQGRDSVASESRTESGAEDATERAGAVSANPVAEAQSGHRENGSGVARLSVYS
jgi:hypothetical protein